MFSGALSHWWIDTVTGILSRLIVKLSLVATKISLGPVILNRSFDFAMFSSFSFSVLASDGGRFRKTFSPLWKTAAYLSLRSLCPLYVACANAEGLLVLSNIVVSLSRIPACIC